MAKLNMLYRYIYGLVLKKVHGIIKFSKKALLKSYIDIKNEKWFWKEIFLSRCIMQLLEKLCNMWENTQISNLRQLKEERTVYYQNQTIIQQMFFWKSISNRNEKMQIIMKISVYWGLSILKLSKIVM